MAYDNYLTSPSERLDVFSNGFNSALVQRIKHFIKDQEAIAAIHSSQPQHEGHIYKHTLTTGAATILTATGSFDNHVHTILGVDLNADTQRRVQHSQHMVSLTVK